MLRYFDETVTNVRAATANSDYPASSGRFLRSQFTMSLIKYMHVARGRTASISPVATLRPAAVGRACKYVGSIATSSTNVLYL